MASFAASIDATRRVVLTPTIARAFWSRRRAWHGAQLRLHVETRYVPDGTELAFEIWEDDTAEGNPDDFIAQVPGSHRVMGNRCVVPYVLDWDPARQGREIELDGSVLEFRFHAIIERYELRARSTRLYVPLEPFRPSV